MGKSAELKKTNKVVMEVLKENPEARNNDDCLIIEVCKRMNPLCVNLSFETVMRNRKILGLPVLETIRRTGQKVRETYPELAGNSDAEAARVLSEQAHREYAKRNM